LLQGELPQTTVFWRGRNWDTVIAKIHWDGSRKATILQLKSTVPKQKLTAAEKQKETEALTANPKEPASQIPKVSAQVEMSCRAPQKVVSNQ